MTEWPLPSMALGARLHKKPRCTRSAARRARLGEVAARILHQHDVELRLRHAGLAQVGKYFFEQMRRLPVRYDRRRHRRCATAPAPHRIVRKYDLPLEADAQKSDERRLPGAIRMEQLEPEAVEAQIRAAI